MSLSSSCCAAARLSFPVRAVVALAVLALGGISSVRADVPECSPYIRSEIWTVGSGAHLISSSKTNKVGSLEPEATYEARIYAGTGSSSAGLNVNGAVALSWASIIDGSFNVAPTSFSSSNAYWHVGSPTAYVTFRFKVSDALYLWSHDASSIPLSFDVWAECSGTKYYANLQGPLVPFVVATADVGDFTAQAGKSYDLPITVGATGGQVVSNMKPLGALKVRVIEGDADLIDCATAPKPASFSQVVGGLKGAKEFHYTCTAKKKGKLQLSFPGVEAQDKDNKTLRSNEIVQTGIVTIAGSLKLSMQFDKTALDANGSPQSMSTATVTVKDAGNNLAADQSVDLDGPLWRVSSSVRGPRVIVCDDTGKRVYPGTPESAYTFTRSTHSDGKFTFDVSAALDSGPAGASSPEQGLGNLQMDGFLNNADSDNPDDTHKAITLDIKPDPNPSTPMDTVATTLQGLMDENSSTLTLGTSFGTIKVPFRPAALAKQQKAMLSWVQALQEGGKFNVDFGPIRSANGSAGIVFYPRSNPGPLLDYFEGVSSALPSDYTVMVLPFKGAGNVLGGATLFLPDFHSLGMTLTEWEQGKPAGLSSGDPGYDQVRGKAVPGFSQGGELGYYYFGYPYPPSATTAESAVAQSACLNPRPDSTYVKLHSPLNVLVTDSDGNRTGVTAAGEAVAEIPGSLVVAPKKPGKGETSISLPVGNYRISLVGTGAGSATLAVINPAATGSSVNAFTFDAAKGSTGALTVTAAGATSALAYAGKKYAAHKPFVMTVAGMPKAISATKVQTVKLTIKNFLGKALNGARVTASAKKFKTLARSNSKGVATFSTRGVGKNKTVTVAVTATGYKSVTAKVPVQ